MAWDVQAGMRQLQDSINVLMRMESLYGPRLGDPHEWLQRQLLSYDFERIANAERKRRIEEDERGNQQ